MTHPPYELVGPSHPVTRTLRRLVRRALWHRLRAEVFGEGDNDPDPNGEGAHVIAMERAERAAWLAENPRKRRRTGSSLGGA